jgi:TnpA family transposase
LENYNGVNDYIRFGKRGELASNRREEQELGMLCLHILQSSLALVFSEQCKPSCKVDMP